MSNYINVLRRLERERRSPESAPSPATPLAREAVPARAPTSISTPIVEPEPAAPAVAFKPSPIERTVIPLPSVSPPAPTPAPVVATAPAAAPAAPVAAPLPPPAPTVRHAEHVTDTRRARAFAPPAHPGIATLLDAIRLISNGRPTRVVVFCGASNAEAVTTLAESLVTHANRTGMPAFLATLTRTASGSALVPADGTTMDAVLPVDLNSTPSVDALSLWSEKVDPDVDLVVITGPPLATSIDAALLACAADGLVIVAESEVTERAALQLAAERARIAGCNTLGVVIHGSKNRLPRWLGRLMGDRSESQ